MDLGRFKRHLTFIFINQKRVTYQLSFYMFDNEKNGDVTQESKNYIKYIGVLAHKNLTWKYHIDAITAKISKTIGLIYKTSALHTSSYTIIYLPKH